MITFSQDNTAREIAKYFTPEYLSFTMSFDYHAYGFNGIIKDDQERPADVVIKTGSAEHLGALNYSNYYYFLSKNSIRMTMIDETDTTKNPRIDVGFSEKFLRSPEFCSKLLKTLIQHRENKMPDNVFVDGEYYIVPVPPELREQPISVPRAVTQPRRRTTTRLTNNAITYTLSEPENSQSQQ